MTEINGYDIQDGMFEDCDYCGEILISCQSVSSIEDERNLWEEED